MSRFLPFENSTSLSLGELKYCQKQIKIKASQHFKIQTDLMASGSFSSPSITPQYVISCLLAFSVLVCFLFLAAFNYGH